MSFKGLFIGIDKHKDTQIQDLSCAGRDALALHALFSDTFGENATLLMDEHATLSNIEKQFQELAQCDDEDFVVIAYSGHGTETHELVSHDTDVYDIPSTTISLDVLTDWFSKIPAKNLICFMDCCFSGGMGAKVLKLPFKSRSIHTVEDAISRLSGKGRLIVTATSPTQEAWENQRFGHGLLTYHLIYGLQGTEEVNESGQINILKLLDFVTKRVISSASSIGKVQTPTIKGTLDSLVTWPPLLKGEIYNQAFPEVTYQVTEELDSLQNCGFSKELLNVWKQNIPTLNQLQIDAINEFHVLEGNHLVVSAPTSSGKTMIGELATLKGISEHKRTLFLFPLKALVNDKHRHFNQVYGSFGVRTIRATGDTIDDIPDLINGKYDICLMTYEKCSSLILNFPHILEQVGIIVVDEVQMIADNSRGVNLEFLLTILKMKRRIGIEPQIIALSAVIGDTNGFEHWLDGRLLRRDERPIPLDEGIIRFDGSYRFVNGDTQQDDLLPTYVNRIYGKNSGQDWIKPLVKNLISEGKQVIVFRQSRPEARSCALYLADFLDLPPAQSALDALSSGDPSVASEALKKALNGGVAFHISDLDREERQIIEEEFRKPNSELKVIAATTTLAMGVNTPTEAVIVAGLVHPGSNEPYSVAEYKNIVGRAGRLGFSEKGHSFLMALTQRDEAHFWQTYVNGQPEDLKSHFLSESTDPRSLIIRVLVAAKLPKSKGMKQEDIKEFLENSYGVYQHTIMYPKWKWDENEILQSIENLERHNLIQRDNQTDLISLTELGWVAGQGGIEVESIVRLVNVLQLLTAQEITDPALLTLVQLTVELDNQYFPMNKRGHKKESQSWFGELSRQGISRTITQSLSRHIYDQHQGILRAKKAIACLFYITNLPINEIENVMNRHTGKFNGAAGPVRQVCSRTNDILPIVARIVEITFPEMSLEDRVERILIRLETGVPAQIVDIARYVGSRFTRADYQSLIKSGKDSIQSIENSLDEELLDCLGNNSEKLLLLRQAIESHKKSQEEQSITLPVLPQYEP